MASTSSLERIAGLVDKLGPISSKQRGMRIEAQEWNLVVEVLLGVLQVDRLQEQRTDTLLDQRFSTKDHQHQGEVNLSWLDADLQARLGGGGESSIATRQRLAEMNQKIQALTDQGSRLTNALEASQRVLDDTIVNNADKTRALIDFERRFKGVEDLRTTMTTVSNQVGSVQTNVERVLELRNSLQDAAGNPINVLQLRNDLTALQAIRENLKGIDGNLLRLRDIETKLNEVSDVVGVGGENNLDSRFAGFRATLQESVNQTLDTRIAGVLTTTRGEASAAEERLRGEILVASTQNRDATRLEITAQIRNTTETFNNTLDTRLNSLRDSVTQAAIENTRVLLDQRLAGLPDLVRTNVDTAVASVRDTLSMNLQATLTATLNAQIQTIDTRLAQQMSALEASNATLTASIPGMVSQQVSDALPELRTTLSQQVSQEVLTARTTFEASLNARVDAAVSTALQNLDSRIASAVTQQTADLDAKIATAVTAATTNLPGLVTDEVRLQIDAVNFEGRIQDRAAAITTQLRSEMRTSLAEQDARTSGAIQNVTTLLHGQISAGISSGLATAREFSTTQNAALRNEMTQLLQTGIQATRDEILVGLDERLRINREVLAVDLNNIVDAQIRTTNADLNTRIRVLETGRIGPNR
jgi:hypothetical protein